MKKYSVSVEIRKMQTNTQVYLAVRLATIKKPTYSQVTSGKKYSKYI